jgi:hypothetical protein
LNTVGLIIYRVVMPDLRSAIRGLSEKFASSVLAVIRSSSLEDILGSGGSGALSGGGQGARRRGRPRGRPAVKRGPGRPARRLGRGPGRPRGSSSKRLRRRSAKDIGAVSDKIVALVKKHKSGLRSEQIRAELGIAKREWMRPLEAALASKKLTKKGEKRATTYFAR